MAETLKAKVGKAEMERGFAAAATGQPGRYQSSLSTLSGAKTAQAGKEAGYTLPVPLLLRCSSCPYYSGLLVHSEFG